MFDNGVLKGASGPKREEITGISRKLLNDGLHSLYSLSDVSRIIKSKKMRCAGCLAYTYTVETRNAYTFLVGKHKGERQIGRLRHRWEDNIKMDFKEIGCEGVDRIH
jgi:hypothetical protein